MSTAENEKSKESLLLHFRRFEICGIAERIYYAQNILFIFYWKSLNEFVYNLEIY